MKKRVTFLAALLVAACFGATVAMAEGSAKVTAQSGLNMRQGPGINYNVVTVLNNGATVNVVTPDDGNGWTYVTSGKNAGWVATKYLSGSAATTQAPSWRGSAVNCTVKSDANIRRGPGTDFGVLGVVPAGFTVSVDSYQDGWASVTWGDVSGYIATKLLNGLPAANGGTSTASNSTSGRYEGADVTCTLNSDANLRSGPATSYEVLTAVPAGFTVTVHSYANGWSCVTWGDTTGYISNSLINGLPTANGGELEFGQLGEQFDPAAFEVAAHHRDRLDAFDALEGHPAPLEQPIAQRGGSRRRVTPVDLAAATQGGFEA